MSQWTAYRKLPSLFRMVPSLIPYDLPFPKLGVPNAPQRPISRRMLPLVEYDRKYRQDFFFIRQPHDDVAFCQITLAVISFCVIKLIRGPLSTSSPGHLPLQHLLPDACANTALTDSPTTPAGTGCCCWPQIITC